MFQQLFKHIFKADVFANFPSSILLCALQYWEWQVKM